MMTKINKSRTGLMTCLLLAFIMTSCSKKEDVPTTPIVTTTAAQDKLNIESTVNIIGDDAVSIVKTEGVKAVSSLARVMSKSPVFGKKASLSSEIASKLRTTLYSVGTMFNFKPKQYGKTNSGNFNLAENAGTYTWNASDSSWITLKGQPADKVIIKFPSDTLSTINDATISINDYKEQLITNKGDSSYYPSRLSADMKVNSIKVASIEYTGTFNNDGMPVTLDLAVYNKPFNLQISVTNIQATVTAELSLTNENESVRILGLMGSVEFTDNSKNEIKIVKGEVSYKELSLKGNVNFQAIKALPHDSVNGRTPEQINANFAVAIYYAGAKTGDFKFVKGDNDEPKLIVVFKDGSSKDAQEYLKEITTKIKDNFKGFKFG